MREIQIHNTWSLLPWSTKFINMNFVGSEVTKCPKGCLVNSVQQIHKQKKKLDTNETVGHGVAMSQTWLSHWTTTMKQLSQCFSRARPSSWQWTCMNRNWDEIPDEIALASHCKRQTVNRQTEHENVRCSAGCKWVWRWGRQVRTLGGEGYWSRFPKWGGLAMQRTNGKTF